jgi:peptide/nickel transport system permease protein
VNRIFSELPIVAAVLGLTELGELLLRAYLDLDMYVAGAILLLLTFVIVFMNFVSDISACVARPAHQAGSMIHGRRNARGQTERRKRKRSGRSG